VKSEGEKRQKISRKILFLAAISFILGLALVALILLMEGVVDSGDKTVEFDGVLVVVEVADTPALRTRGLSGREGLDESGGMLFIFDTPGEYGFHMKDMKFPIDIIWIGQNMRVVDIVTNLPPESYPETVTSSEPAQYVLEVNSGFTSMYDIDIGDEAVFRNIY